MLFIVSKSSNYQYKDQVEIKTLEELMDFVYKNGSISINPEWTSGEEEWDLSRTPVIEIYDFWRERKEKIKMMKDVFVVTIDSYPLGIKDNDRETYLFGIFPSEEAANLAIKVARENCPYDAFKRDWVFDSIRIYRAPFGKAMEITYDEDDTFAFSAIPYTDICLA